MKPITIAELIEEFAECPDDWTVHFDRDNEGIFIADSTGEVQLRVELSDL